MTVVILIVSHIVTNSFLHVAQQLPPECMKYASCDEFQCDAVLPARDCAVARDNRECRREIIGIHFDDPSCEASKAAQNAIYDRNKAICEAQKASEIESRRLSCLSALQTCQSIAKACAELRK